MKTLPAAEARGGESVAVFMREPIRDFRHGCRTVDCYALNCIVIPSTDGRSRFPREAISIHAVVML